jgi:hypothetical protein
MAQTLDTPTSGHRFIRIALVFSRQWIWAVVVLGQLVNAGVAIVMRRRHFVRINARFDILVIISPFGASPTWGIVGCIHDFRSECER